MGHKNNFVFAKDFLVASLIIELIGCQLKRPKPNEPLHFHTHLFYKTLVARSQGRSPPKKTQLSVLMKGFLEEKIEKVIASFHLQLWVN